MILLKGRLWQAHSEPPSAEVQNVRAPYTTAIFLGERIRPPSPAALLFGNVFPTYIVIAVCVCVCVPARARVLVRVLMCAYVLRNVCSYVRLWWNVWGCVRACVIVRTYVYLLFVFVVCVAVHVCVCECVFVRVHAWEGLPHGFCMGPTWSKPNL